MPDTEARREFSKEHIQEAKDNYDRYLRFLHDPRGLDIDWALVALFYCALHLIQAHAEKHARNLRVPIPSVHTDRSDDDRGRDRYVYEQCNDIYVAYNKLKAASEDARYKRIKRNVQQVEALHDEFFYPILTHFKIRHIDWEEKQQETV
ncbi:MAG TPA: hypothetical protein VFA07_05720 [Chthonomonadaceae bacterium]|nr:hypothetical protein [Chthonomonadaceae bacterium]